jgi:hypothetical protein
MQYTVIITRLNIDYPTVITTLKVSESRACCVLDSSRRPLQLRCLQLCRFHDLHYCCPRSVAPTPLPTPQAALGSITGAASQGISFNYGCLVAQSPTSQRAMAQLFGSLFVPCVVVAFSLALWALRWVGGGARGQRRCSGLRVWGRLCITL